MSQGRHLRPRLANIEKSFLSLPHSLFEHRFLDILATAILEKSKEQTKKRDVVSHLVFWEEKTKKKASLTQVCLLPTSLLVLVKRLFDQRGILVGRPTTNIWKFGPKMKSKKRERRASWYDFISMSVEMKSGERNKYNYNLELGSQPLVNKWIYKLVTGGWGEGDNSHLYNFLNHIIIF